MQEYVTRVERLPDGSLCTTLHGGGRRVHQEPVPTLRRGKRRAYDLLCTAVDTEVDADSSIGLVGPRPVRPVAGSDPAEPAGAAEPAVRSASADAALRAVIEMALQSGPWDAASISVLGPGGSMQPVAFTDERAADADRLQVEMGEGPCLDAVGPEPDGAPREPMVIAVDLRAEHRWPRWAPAATAQGVRAVVSLRLFTDHSVGSISLYARHPLGVDREALEDAQIVAALASVVLARVHSERDLRAVDSRGLIGQAQGMLMQRYGLTAESAFAVLRRYSQQHNTTLVVLAEQLTTTGELPDLRGPHPVNERPGHERSPDRAGPASTPGFGPSTSA